MQPARTPLWQQATALVSISASGAIAGLSFVPGQPGGLASPASLPVRLLALQQSARGAPSGDAMLRAAIVNVARHYLRLAADRSPAEMEAMIWRRASLDAADHGASCAAFASLTLELGARAAGRVSWVSGGPSYPWPLHSWADVRVDENPESPAIVSVRQDAQANHRWHPLGDGYRPRPGDWVLFGGHVEVVTEHRDGELRTIGGDSLPDFSVNAHEYAGPLAEHGVQGFVDNGHLAAAGTPASGGPGPARQERPGTPAEDGPAGAVHGQGSAAVPGHRDRTAEHHHGQHHHGLGAPGRQRPDGLPGTASVPGLISPASAKSTSGPSPAGPAAAHSGRAPAGQQRPALAAPAPASQAAASSLGAASIPGTVAQRPELRAASAPGATDPGPAHHAGDRGPQVPEPADPAHRSHSSVQPGHRPASELQASPPAAGPAADAEVPGLAEPAATAPAGHRTGARAARSGGSGQLADTTPAPGTAAIPGLGIGPQPARGSTAPGSTVHRPGAHGQPPGHPGQQTGPATPAPVLESPAERAFISEIAPGAVAAQRRYGVPASVTIAQAIMESGWGQSVLAARDHNLFGIKGTGPAGSDLLPTREFQRGQWVTIDAGFRVYHSDAQSIDDHGRLLATTGFYTRAMQLRRDPDAFAQALTGVYATDPDYGSQLITLMRRYDLHRFDLVPASGRRAPAAHPGPSGSDPAASAPSPSLSTSPGPSRPAPSPAPAVAEPSPSAAPAPAPTRSPSAAPSAPAASSEAAPGPAPAPAPPSAPAAADVRAAPIPAAPGTLTPPASPASRRHPAAPVAGSARGERAAWPGRPSGASPVIRPGRPRRPALYRQPVPLSVRNAFVTSAKVPLIRAEALYRDVAAGHRISWQLLAACDWMQCKARPGYSPVHGEKLGATNPDGSAYRTKSAALAQCAEELTCLARVVYGIELTSGRALSVRELADVFAAFRWGALLRTHSTSAMEFPYSVAGLTAQHLGMRWPAIPAMSAPDKPGTRFRMPFGAIPVLLRLRYPATT